MNKLHIQLLGTGTSQGVPVIGCDCPTCTSSDPKDQRLRASVAVQLANTRLIIDIGPDFRQQLLRSNISDVDAILLTHEHNDHMIGLDDVRPLNFKQQRNMPIYARASVHKDLKERFPYVFAKKAYPGAPRLELHEIDHESFSIKDIEILPIESLHGRLPIYGFRIGDFTYLTDAKYFEQGEFDKIRGTKILVISALHQTMHHSHLQLSEAIGLINELKVEQAYLTHISHRMGRVAALEKNLPAHIRFAYDGQIIEMEY